MVEEILLSPPDVSALERNALISAFDGGWIAPVGPELDRFEVDLSDYTGSEACVALSSGTAALHLALLSVGVQPGDQVVVQSATFAASAFAVRHAGATPIFLDSEFASWCLDPVLLEAFLSSRAAAGELPRAVMPVDLYGSTADYQRISQICSIYGVAVVRDAAEALGSTSTTGPVGATGIPSVLSFNGNKIITTSSGGALIGNQETVDRARYLATQARQPVLHYEHTDIGFNYRLSNLLASIGSAQLATLELKIQRRTLIHDRYVRELPELEWCQFRHTPRPNQWLTVAIIPKNSDPSAICKTLAEQRIEARPGWKPMHRQPIFSENEYIAGHGVADLIFDRGLCLPSGSTLTDDQQGRVIASLQVALAAAS